MIHLLTEHRESGIRLMLDEANKLEGVHHLEIGLTDLPTPPYIVEAAVHAARQGYTGYTPNAGFSTHPLSLEPSGHVIAAYSCSKIYSMTGWRVGFAVSSPEIARVLSKLQEAYVACAPSISQQAAEAALTGPQACVEKMVSTHRLRRELTLELCVQYVLRHVRLSEPPDPVCPLCP